jgi:hypothetical protein
MTADPGAEKILNADLSEMFAIEMAQVAKPRAATRAPAAAQTRATSNAKSSKSTRQATASAKILQEEAARLRDTKRQDKNLRPGLRQAAQAAPPHSRLGP